MEFGVWTKSLATLAVLAGLILAGCSSIGDFGRLQEPLVNDDIHAWVGQEAADGPLRLHRLDQRH